MGVTTFGRVARMGGNLAFARLTEAGTGHENRRKQAPRPCQVSRPDEYEAGRPGWDYASVPPGDAQRRAHCRSPEKDCEGIDTSPSVGGRKSTLTGPARGVQGGRR